MGSPAGYLGLSNSPSGYSGRLYAAGYPGAVSARAQAHPHTDRMPHRRAHIGRRHGGNRARACLHAALANTMPFDIPPPPPAMRPALHSQSRAATIIACQVHATCATPMVRPVLAPRTVLRHCCHLLALPASRPRIPCTALSAPGEDGILLLKSYPPSTQCYTACAIAESGQAGQAAFSISRSSYFVRGVLSHGPPPGTCKGTDAYTELTKVCRRCSRAGKGILVPNSSSHVFQMTVAAPSCVRALNMPWHLPQAWHNHVEEQAPLARCRSSGQLQLPCGGEDEGPIKATD